MGSTTHEGAPGASSAPWCLVGPTGLLSCAPLAPWVSSGQKKISKKFHGIWTSFGIDFLRSKKNKQKTVTGAGHYVNRLVLKNDINLLLNENKTSKIDNITVWNNQKL